MFHALGLAALLAQTVLTGNLNIARTNCVAAVLNDGRVLVTSSGLASTEIFDPVDGRFSIGPDMHAARSGQTATLLPTGDVLVVGGTAELFDGNSFTPIGGINTPRSSHSATVLQDGKVLIAGGLAENGMPLGDAEIYDPVTRAFIRIDSMNTPRFGHGAALLPDGRVLIAGGYEFNDLHGFATTAEIYDPATHRFTATPPPLGAHLDQILTLPDGNALLVGIIDTPLVNSISEIFDTRTGTFQTALPVWAARFGARAVVQRDGAVLVSGGGSFLATNDLQVFDPAAHTFRSLGALQMPRMRHAAVALPDGRSLFIGGEDQTKPTQTSESLGTAKRERHRAVN